MITFLLKREFNTVIKLELSFPGRILRVKSLNMKCKTDISKTRIPDYIQNYQTNHRKWT